MKRPKLTIENIKDVRLIGLVVFGVIVILITVSGVGVIQQNKGLEEQITLIEQENKNLQLEVDNMRLKNEYLKTDDYLELAARKHFNMAKPGETLIAVPKEVLSSYSEGLVIHSIKQETFISKDQKGAWYDRFYNNIFGAFR